MTLAQILGWVASVAGGIGGWLLVAAWREALRYRRSHAP